MLTWLLAVPGEAVREGQAGYGEKDTFANKSQAIGSGMADLFFYSEC